MLALSSALATPSAGADERPVVYLTFDDGPSAGSVTTELLAVLAEHGAIATFFVQAPDVRADPAAVAAIVAGGHAIGNHADSHDNVLGYGLGTSGKSLDDLRARFAATESALATAGAPASQCWRAPFGATDANADAVAAELGFGDAAIRWYLDPKDWDADVSAADIRRTLDRVVDRDIVLMHDGQGDHTATLEAVRSFLTDRGDEFRFAALPQCLGQAAPQPPDTNARPPEQNVDPAPVDPAPVDPPADPDPTEPEVVCGGTPSSDYATEVDADADAAQIWRLYLAHFRRQPDSAGFAYWLGLKRSGLTLPDMAQQFQASKEFDLTYGALTNLGFVDLLYDNVLCRDHDTDGRNYWVSELEAGLTRHDMLILMSESTEYLRRTGTRWSATGSPS